MKNDLPHLSVKETGMMCQTKRKETKEIKENVEIDTEKTTTDKQHGTNKTEQRTQNKDHTTHTYPTELSL